MIIIISDNYASLLSTLLAHLILQ